MSTDAASDTPCERACQPAAGCKARPPTRAHPPVAEAAIALEVVPLLLLLRLLALAAQALALSAAALVTPRVTPALVAVRELPRLESARAELLALRWPVVDQVERLLLRAKRGAKKQVCCQPTARPTAAHARDPATRLVLREEVEYCVHAAAALVPRCCDGKVANERRQGKPANPKPSCCAREPGTHFRQTCQSPSASSLRHGPACHSC